MSGLDMCGKTADGTIVLDAKGRKRQQGRHKNWREARDGGGGAKKRQRGAEENYGMQNKGDTNSSQKGHASKTRSQGHGGWNCGFILRVSAQTEF